MPTKGEIYKDVINGNEAYDVFADFDETELYKLNTVAQKFGGPFAKKVLVASYYGKNNEDSHRYFAQRAEDMGIDLIENVHELSDEAFAKKIGNILV